MKFLRLLSFCLLTPAALPAQTGLEARTALVIGCDYVGTGNQLPSPARDAKAIAAKLEQLGFAVTLRINPELEEMDKVSNEFSAGLKLRKGVGLFYFSGHGAQVDDRNYLIPNKARLSYREDLRTRAYAAQDMITRMEASGTRLNMLFLDACRTNELPSASSKSLTSGFASMQAASGMLISFASARNTVALDSGAGSVYTNALLAHMATPGVSVLDMLTRVNGQVKRDTGGKQIPFMEVGLDGTFAFAPAGVSGSLVSSLTLPPRTTPSLIPPSVLFGTSGPAATPAGGSGQRILESLRLPPSSLNAAGTPAPASSQRIFDSLQLQPAPWRAPYSVAPATPANR